MLNMDFISFILLSSLLFTSLPLASSDFDPTRVTELSWNPRAFLYKGFLSYQECDHLISLARDKLQKSMVADSNSGYGMLSNARTSSGMFLSKHQDDIVTRIERRVASWTFLPEKNAEPMQVLRYEVGQKFDPHFDFFHDEYNIKQGGHRIATVLMYLTNVEKGGETVFPHAEGLLTQQKNESWSDCAKNGYAVKPEKGDAILFFSFNIDITPNQASLHGSCPVIVGEKWSATKWIHVTSFDEGVASVSDEECDDQKVLCSTWAMIGECEKDPDFMIGNEDSPGFCRKSCRAC